jgi:signal transduction histidine kinase
MVLAIFIVNGAITAMNLWRIRVNTALVEHSHELLSELKLLRIRMVDAETGMRGYIIAQDAAFLQPYQDALKLVGDTLHRLDALAREDSRQASLAAELRRQVDASLQQMKTTVAEAGQSGGHEKALARVRSGEGKNRMDAIRNTLQTMEKSEIDVLEQRDADSRAAYQIALTSGILASLFGMVAAGFGYYVLARDMLQREESERRLKEANEFLEHRVAERTNELTQANSVMRTEIEERRRAEEQVRLFAEELQRSNRELEQFASVASHDLQEPLRKIQAFGDRLESRFREVLGEAGRDYLDRMQSSAKRMRKLIDDLLEYSRVTTKAQPFAPVNLANVVQEVTADLETRLQQTGGRVEVSDLPVVRASPLQMRQLFQNLIGNALKFHRPDEPPVVRVSSHTVHAAADGADGHNGAGGLQCEIVVEDNGIGFEPEYGERIFDLFQRLHGRDEYEGTGIGLAICRKIVDRHNGHIVAQGTPGKGSRFLVTLPLEQSA